MKHTITKATLEMPYDDLINVEKDMHQILEDIDILKINLTIENDDTAVFVHKNVAFKG